VAESKGSTERADGERRADRARSSMSVDAVRTRVAQLLWLVCVVAALFLAVGALTYALEANEDNALVAFVRDGAEVCDLGIFSLTNGIKEFTGENAEIKNALFNWGIGAVAWLVLGRILDRVVRP
jgi:hypothetical protein